MLLCVFERTILYVATVALRHDIAIKHNLEALKGSSVSEVRTDMENLSVTRSFYVFRAKNQDVGHGSLLRPSN
jgi:hypothetical protein